MAIDDSFKKPGAVPFKWEIRPGVPKIQQQQQQKKEKPPKKPPPPLSTPASPFIRHRSSPSPQKLKPPPAGLIFLPPPLPHSRSFRSAPRTRSERWRFDQPAVVRPDCVSPGCFPSPLLKRKDRKRGIQKPAPGSEPDYTSDLETLSRWSISSRKSFSSLRGSPMSIRSSPMSSSFSSYQSSPRLVSDAEWAGFGLF